MAQQNTTPLTGPPLLRVQQPAQRHPRRPPAERSVSLAHAPSSGEALKAQTDATLPSEQTSNTSSLVAHRDSSGEVSNADNWFDRSNKNTSNNKPTFDDSDSPFNFENDDSPMLHQNTSHDLLSVRHPMVRGNSSGSSSEEYRSVIDDLTIENKRLKKKLKKYERSHDSPMQRDRLFEVRVHGLPPEKKRELEETLRKFASTLNRSPASGKTLSSSAVSGQSRLGTALNNASSSLSSLAPRIADSGYGSMTATAKNSTPHSGGGSASQSNQASNISQSKDKSIRSYLHDIPEGLMPHHPTVMTEKSRKKLVVRRLEQIFGGRVADPSLGQQPLQQQEVSNTAAKDERTAMEATGRKVTSEGHREAPIMEDETEEPMANNNSKFSQDQDKQAEDGRDSTFIADHAGTSPASPTLPTEQRPTRPLDLDPHRAQDPLENIEYFRHLGFLNNHAPSGSSKSLVDGQNWIYLNLLVNMAQLHTINVTTDFIKDAISEHSKKLELSSDGRKVRWRGNNSPGKGLSGTSSMHETDSGGSPDMPPGVNAGDKRIRPAHLETDTGRQPKKQAVDVQPMNQFAYRPIIPSNRVPSDSEESSNDSMAEPEWTPSQFEEAATGVSSGLASSSKMLGLLSARKDNGPIIFYNNATFCTDLSGDVTLLKRMHKSIESRPITGSPLGSVQKKSSSARSSHRGSTRGSTKGSVRGSVIGSGASHKGSERGVFDISELASSIESLSPLSATLKFPSNEGSPKHVSFAEPEVPMPLEASGIGGVTPHDNIAITVQRKYATSNRGRKKTSLPINSKISAILPSSHQPAEAPSKECIISTHEKNLEPSPLPPASLHFDLEDAKTETDSDSLDVETSSDAEMEESETAEPMVSVTLGARTAISPSNSDYSTSDDGESDDDDDDDEDNADSQIDFLATARAADPETIRAKEREYDAEMAERLAEEIPAGSSAATAGGGSGFNSPEDAMRQSNEGSNEGKSASS